MELYLKLRDDQTSASGMNFVKESLDESAASRMIGESIGDKVVPNDRASMQLWRRQLRSAIKQGLC